MLSAEKEWREIFDTDLGGCGLARPANDCNVKRCFHNFWSHTKTINAGPGRPLFTSFCPLLQVAHQVTISQQRMLDTPSHVESRGSDALSFGSFQDSPEALVLPGAYPSRPSPQGRTPLSKPAEQSRPAFGAPAVEAHVGRGQHNITSSHEHLGAGLLSGRGMHNASTTPDQPVQTGHTRRLPLSPSMKSDSQADDKIQQALSNFSLSTGL